VFEQKRLGDNGTSAATSKESGDRGDEMDEKDGQVAHLAIVPISTSVTRLGTRWDLCDKSRNIRTTTTSHDKPQYEVEGDKVYETDAYGRKQQKFEIKNKDSRSK
jgi:hypothetical protein